MKKNYLCLLIFTLCFVLSASMEADKTKHKKNPEEITPITKKVATSDLPLNKVKEFEIITKTFPLNYIAPQVLSEKLKLSFSSITVLCDNDTNSLVVNAFTNQFNDITSFIAMSDSKLETVQMKVFILEISGNYEQGLISSTTDLKTILLTKSEFSKLYNLDINGEAKKIYESANFITPYGSTATISFKSDYSKDYSAELSINLTPVNISTQSAQIGVSIALNAYWQGASTNTKTTAMVQLQRPAQNSILFNDVITKETRELAFSLPFMASINEVGQVFNKESVLNASSRIALIIQLWEIDNE